MVQDPRPVELGINVVRGLAMDAPSRPNSGHPGTAMARPPGARALDPRDALRPARPTWPDRDRFVLSNGHASILQYAFFHLTGYDLTLDDLRQFRQWDRRTPGHPEYRHTPGIEVTTGPLGQGFANGSAWPCRARGCGRRFGAEVVRPPHLRHLPATAASMEGDHATRPPRWPATSASAACCAVYDDNHITIDGPTELAYDDDSCRASRPTAGDVRYLGESANDVDVLEGAVRDALEHPADGPDARPNLARPAQPHRLALPEADRHRRGARQPLRRRRDPGDQGDPRPPPRRDLRVPDDVRAFYGQRIARGARDHAAWVAPHVSPPGTPTPAAECGRPEEAGLPGWAEGLPRDEAGTELATRQRPQPVHRRHRAAHLPGLVAGRPDLTGQQRGQGERAWRCQSRRVPGRDPGPLRHP